MQTSLATVLPKDFCMKAATIATVCLWGVIPLEKPVMPACGEYTVHLRMMWKEAISGTVFFCQPYKKAVYIW